MTKTFEIGRFQPRRDAHLQLGGYCRLPADAPWPKKGKVPMAFFLRIAAESPVLASAGVVLPTGHDVSVFCSHTRGKFDYDLALHDISDAARLAKVPSRVIVHPRAEKNRLFPPKMLAFPSARGELVPVEDEPTSDSGALRRSLLAMSKAGGPPSWLQDPIPVEKNVFVMQLTGVGAQGLEDVTGGGVGYLFLPKKPKPGMTGHFFCQFS